MNGSNERIPRRRLLKDVATLATAAVLFPRILARHAVGAETVDKAGILGFSCVPLCFWKEMYTERRRQRNGPKKPASHLAVTTLPVPHGPAVTRRGPCSSSVCTRWTHYPVLVVPRK